MKKHILLFVSIMLATLNLFAQAGQSSSNGFFYAKVPNHLTLGAGTSTPTVRVTVRASDGFVGIGSFANPNTDITQLLHVKGGNILGDQIFSSTGNFNSTSATGNLSLQTNGNSRLTVFNTGWVGIGLASGTTPSAMLHINNGDVLANQFSATLGNFIATGSSDLSLIANGKKLTLSNSTGRVGIGLPGAASEMLHVNGNILADKASTTSGTFNSFGSSNLSLSTNGTNRVTVQNTNGYVGIGTTTAPTEMLQVNGNALAIQMLASSGTFASTGSSDLSLVTNGNSRVTVLNSNGYVGIGTAPTEMLQVNGNTLATQMQASTGNFASTGSSNLSLVTNGTSRVTVANSNGFVGIGVNTPDQLLHVKGGNVVVDNGNSPTIYTGTGSTELNRYLQLSNSKDLQSPSGLKAGGVLIADNYSYASPSKNDLVVKGTVAIGTPLTSNPNNYVLAVNGKIGAKDVQIENKSSAWPDYVFAKEYNLPSLTEVEKFIQENNHLQDVPSAKQVEENGHSLGDMDVVLLKKVEELTLYIIQQQKQIDELKKKLEENKK